jgi:hypothetical protein
MGINRFGILGSHSLFGITLEVCDQEVFKNMKPSTISPMTTRRVTRKTTSTSDAPAPKVSQKRSDDEGSDEEDVPAPTWGEYKGQSGKISLSIQPVRGKWYDKVKDAAEGAKLNPLYNRNLAGENGFIFAARDEKKVEALAKKLGIKRRGELKSGQEVTTVTYKIPRVTKGDKFKVTYFQKGKEPIVIDYKVYEVRKPDDFDIEELDEDGNELEDLILQSVGVFNGDFRLGEYFERHKVEYIPPKPKVQEVEKRRVVRNRRKDSEEDDQDEE